jgi:hypothetical protein
MCCGVEGAAAVKLRAAKAAAAGNFIQVLHRVLLEHCLVRRQKELKMKPFKLPATGLLSLWAAEVRWKII